MVTFGTFVSAKSSTVLGGDGGFFGNNSSRLTSVSFFLLEVDILATFREVIAGIRRKTTGFAKHNIRFKAMFRISVCWFFFGDLHKKSLDVANVDAKTVFSNF